TLLDAFCQLQNQFSVVSTQVSRINHKWQPPPRIRFLLNVDVAFGAESVAVGVGAVVHDFQGHVRVAFALWHIESFTLDTGELFAVREALHYVSHISISVYRLQNDSSLAMQNINHVSPFAVG
ncbi:hypothetical protein Dsin_021613, partial [Dipteronia sinensis]